MARYHYTRENENGVVLYLESEPAEDAMDVSDDEIAVGVRPREDARITDTMKEFTWFMGRRYKLVDAADHIGYEWTGRAHGSLADALATLAVQRWLEQWLVAE